MRCSTN